MNKTETTATAVAPSPKQGTPRKARTPRPVPGSVYKPSGSNTLYIKYGGKRITTGLKATKEGWDYAEMMLKKTHLAAIGLLEPDLRSLNDEKQNLPVQPITFDLAFEEFLMLHGVNKMPQTMSHYRIAVYQIVTEPHAMLAVEVAEKAIIQFLQKEGLANSTKNFYLRNFQVFWNFCVRRYSVEKREWMGMYRLKAPQKLVAVFTHEETAQLILYLSKTDEELALLVRFMLATAFRIGQVLTLSWAEVQSTQIERLSKNKDRIEPFPMTTQLAAIIEEVRNIARKRSVRDASKVFRWSNSSRGRVLDKIDAAMEKCGIPKNKRGLHTFRKTAATRWAEAGVPIEQVRVLMGHTDIAMTTKFYVKIQTSALKDRLDGLAE